MMVSQVGKRMKNNPVSGGSHLFLANMQTETIAPIAQAREIRNRPKEKSPGLCSEPNK